MLRTTKLHHNFDNLVNIVENIQDEIIDGMKIGLEVGNNEMCHISRKLSRN